MKTINESPTITDQVLFELATTDSDGCLGTPYQINSVTIYFVERGFADDKLSSYDVDRTDPSLLSALAAAKQLVCDDHSQTNIDALKKAQSNVDKAKLFQTIYYKRSIAVANFGYEVENYPAWLNPDEVPPDLKDKTIEDNLLTPVLDILKNPVPGKFNLVWDTTGMREGDYFLCWTWQPNLVGDTLSASLMFSLSGTPRLTNIPAHITNPDKYQTLMERYLAETCKRKLCDDDLSPQVIRGLNDSVAAGFTLLEDKTTQILDTIDANVTHEYLLPYLANLFNLKLQTNDPALWRRQIKQAIPLFKKKGTYGSLRETLAQSGVRLKKLSRLWQVISPYSWQELFNATDRQNAFTLTRSAVSISAVYYRAEGLANQWEELETDSVELLLDGITVMWAGEQLYEGDSVRIIYNLTTPDDPDKETYILSLPLADTCDERRQNYPLVNWNVRLVEEDDKLFSWLIPYKGPLEENLVFGKIRTEFPYSENVYNMDEYNGSTRESKNPCDIDKAFLDPCKDCPGSMLSIDVEVENISSDRLLDVEEIINECVPFHAVLHSINFSGSINEFIRPPIEEITAVIRIEGEEIMLSGESQSIFNRVIKTANAMELMQRDMLASIDADSSIFDANGLAKNDNVIVVSPGLFASGGPIPYSGTPTDEGYRQVVKLCNYSIDLRSVDGLPENNSNLLEIYAPHPLATSQYSVSSPQGSHAIISAGAFSEPVDQSQFTFRLSNRKFSATVNIEQSNLFVFVDNDNNFSEINIVSQWDIDQGATGPATQIAIGSYGTYAILDILPNGKLIIANDGTLPTTTQTGLIWSILGDSGPNGTLTIANRGIVDFAGASVDTPLFDVANDYILYSGTQYKISGFEPGTVRAYIENYTDGDHGGVSVVVYRRLLDHAIGQFTYQGFTLDTAPTNYETNLSITNGANAAYLPSGDPDQGGLDALENDHFKENYLIKIDDDYYAISEINGTKITLAGPYQDWTKTGTPVTFNIYRYVKNSVSIPPRGDVGLPGHEFSSIDRGGGPIIEQETTDPALEARFLSMAKRNPNQLADVLQQKETISYTIEYDDGSIEQGEV